MTDPEQPKPTGDIAAEFRQLGQNLADLLRGAWESEDRKKIQQEIETGLNDLGASLKKAGQDFTQSPTGQTLKSDVEDLRQRIKSGEVEAKVRSEIINALRTVNEELKKIAPQKPTSPSGDSENEQK
jgi:hypothetical protein